MITERKVLIITWVNITYWVYMVLFFWLPQLRMEVGYVGRIAKYEHKHIDYGELELVILEKYFWLALCVASIVLWLYMYYEEKKWARKSLIWIYIGGAFFCFFLTSVEVQLLSGWEVWMYYAGLVFMIVFAIYLGNSQSIGEWLGLPWAEMRRYVRRGDEARRENRLDEAIYCYKASLEKGENPLAHFGIALCYAEKGSYSEAVIHARQVSNREARELIHSLEQKKVALCKKTYLSGEIDTAINYYKEILKVGLSSPHIASEAHAGLAHCYNNKGAFQEAHVHAKKAYELYNTKDTQELLAYIDQQRRKPLQIEKELKELEKKINRFVGKLTQKEWKILKLHFGIDDCQPHTVSEIKKIYNIPVLESIKTIDVALEKLQKLKKLQWYDDIMTRDDPLCYIDFTKDSVYPEITLLRKLFAYRQAILEAQGKK